LETVRRNNDERDDEIGARDTDGSGMLALTFAIPRGGALRDAQLAAFPMTVGIWAIFVLLFVKLK